MSDGRLFIKPNPEGLVALKKKGVKAKCLLIRHPVTGRAIPETGGYLPEIDALRAIKRGDAVECEPPKNEKKKPAAAGSGKGGDK